MRIAGAVQINGTTIYAYFTDSDGGLKLRLSMDEWDRLNLFEGQQLRIGLPGGRTAEGLITNTDHVPPFVWIHLTPLAAMAAVAAR